MKYLIANWKMSIDQAGIANFLDTLEQTSFPKNVVCGVGAPFVYLNDISAQLAKYKWLVGAQNVSFAQSGAFTGEISASMLKELSVDFCIVGHSERRAMFGETDEVVNTKIQRLQEQNIAPLLCIGETLEQFEQQQTKAVLERQLKNSLANIKCTKGLIVAYEPVWAIGTGKSASNKDIEQNIVFIKQILRKMFGTKAKDIPVLYGGSVKPENASEIFLLDCVDGALVGGASLDCQKFFEIAEKMS